MSMMQGEGAAVSAALYRGLISPKCAIIASFALFASFALRAETTADYVQDGLIACWDGYENTGSGEHVSALSEWVDRVGGRTFTLTGTSCSESGIVFSGSTSSYGVLSETDTDSTFEQAINGTVEIVIQAADGNNRIALISSAASGVTLGRFDNVLLTSCKESSLPVNAGWSDGITTVSTPYASALPGLSFVNGSVAGSGSSMNYWLANSASTYIGMRSGSNPYVFKGTIYAIRLYSGQLTAAQIAANRAVDEKRFVEGNFDTTEPDPYPSYLAGMTGGETITNGTYEIHTFNENGTLTVPSGVMADILLVGGGGGGGTYYGGGGGAGGVLYKRKVALAAGTYSIVIGAGGAAGVYDSTTASLGTEGYLRAMGQTGSNTTFGVSGSDPLFTAHGGGGGGTKCTSSLTYRTGKDGGSGGGGAATASGGKGMNGEGYAGCKMGLDWASGGGGGAGGAATNKLGGTGRAIDITGESVYYGGGGGGYGSWQYYHRYEGCGGIGGGGDATRNYCDNGMENKYYGAQDGTDGLGGGGGASASYDGSLYGAGRAGRGGSGVVIVRVSAVNPDSYDPQIGSVGRIETTATTASFDVSLASFGKDQTGGTLKVAYGLDPDDLSALKTLAVTVAPGTTNVTLTGLKPDSAYYARVSLENGLNRTFVYGETLLFVTPARHAGASGGEISYLDGDVIHKFVSNGVLTIRSSCTVRMLLVAGGGGGGGYGGGGGGAGGVLVLDEAYLPQGKYAVTVGAGGQGGYWGSSIEKRHGANGGDSVIAFAGGAELYRAIGGGGGGSGYASGISLSQVAGFAGGSGGGDGYDACAKLSVKYIALGVPGQGYEGGLHTGDWTSGAGGGAGRNGQTFSSGNNNGNGGYGVTNWITGTAVVYGGGGGGSANHGSYGKNQGLGGEGGGGKGAAISQTTKAEDGTDGLGGGGGGGRQVATGEGHVGGNGGSGVVIVRYAEPADDDPDPYVVFASVDSVEAHRATLTGRLVAVGAGGSSCTVKVAYGLSSDALVFTNTLSTSQTAGDFAFVLEHLVPNKTWYVALSAVNDRGCGDATAPISFQTPDGEKEEGDVELDGFPTIGTVTAGALTADASVPVAFDVTDLGRDATSATAWVEYGTTPAFGEASTNVAIAATGTATATLDNLEAGATYYYAVSVRNDRGYEVKGATQTFALPGAAAVRQTCTFSFSKGAVKVKFTVDSLGAGAHVAKIYVGSSLATRTLLGTMEVAATGEYTYDGTMDCVNASSGASYSAWVVLENTSGEKTFSSETAQSAVQDVRDTSTYYWINAGGGNWLDAANWRSSWAPNDYIVGYPASGSSAQYTNANDVATTIPLTADAIGGSLTVANRNAQTLKVCDLTLCGSGSETLKMGGTLTVGTSAEVKLDALAYVTQNLTVETEGELVLTNAATCSVENRRGLTLTSASNRLTVASGCSISCTRTNTDNPAFIGGYGGRMILDDGTFTTVGPVSFAPAALAKGAKPEPYEIVFRGTAPSFVFSEAGNRFAYTETANIAQPRLTFEIPAEGWAEAPLRSTATTKGYKFFASSVTKTNILVNVAKTSAVFQGGFRGEVPLIRWTSGIDRSQVELGSTGRPSGSFVWYPADAEYPTELRLKVARGFSIIVR